MEGYGRFLGARYKTYDNILWVMGGDWYGAEALPKTRAIVRGLQATDQPRLFTAHNARQSSALDTYAAERRGSASTPRTRSVCRLLAVAAARRTLDQRTRVMPFVYFEGSDTRTNPTGQPRCLRSQAYWPVSDGRLWAASLATHPIWLFNPGWPSLRSTRTGARGMTQYGRLFGSRAWSKLVPDYTGAFLVTGRGSFGADYAASAVTSDGATGIVYTPAQRALGIDMSKIAGGTARAWWFDPATGTATLIGDFPASRNPQVFTPPTAQDWVLVIDNASLNLSAPGS